jgi:hypothetical protein
VKAAFISKAFPYWPVHAARESGHEQTDHTASPSMLPATHPGDPDDAKRANLAAVII